MINNTTLVGRLTRDPELRYTGNDIPVTSFTLAVERPFKNNQGDRDADFINCVAWRKTAGTVAKFALKGTLVGVTGRIQTRNYENSEGRTVYITEVVSEGFQLLEPKSVTDERRAKQGSPNNNQQGNKYQNNSQSNQPTQENTNAKSSMNNDSIDIQDDDLPF